MLKENQAIVVENLSKVYPKNVRAVSDVSFSVKEGEFFGFLGPNGAGKTTTMRMLSTLLKPSSGKVSINGYEIGKQDDWIRCSIGFAMQGVTLDLTASGWENMMLIGTLYELSKKEIEENGKKLLKLLDLEKVASVWVKNYSGGMKKKIIWIIVLLIILGVIGAVVLSAGIITLSRESAFVQSVGFLQRLATISFSDPTIKARFLNMGIAWKGVKERPILGWGQENYAIVFDKYYDPRMHGQEPWFDRVHNSIFDWLVAGGVFGLLAYLSIFVAALWALWRPLFVRAAKDAFTHAERSILTGLLAGYFVHNLTVFDNVTSYILFGTILAFIVYRVSAASEASAIIERRILSGTYLPYVAIAAALAVWALAWWVNSAALAQNRTLLQAIAPHDAGYARNLELFEEAISYGSLGTQEAREQLASFAVGVGQGEFPAELKKNYYETAVSELQAQMAASPLDARFPLFLSNIYRAYGEYDNAETALTLAHTLSLGKQSILFDLAQNAYNKGDRAGALAYLKQAHELDTSVADARVLYAAMAIRLGNDALAAELLAPVIPSGKAAVDPILGAYVSRGQYAPLIPIWRAKIAADPRGTQAYVTLAAIHYQLGQLQEARLVLEEGKRAVPESADQFDRLLAEL